MYLINWQLTYIQNCIVFHYTPLISLFFYLSQANGIIKKLQGEFRGLVEKIKVKNTVTVSQEKVLQKTSDKLQHVEKHLQNTQQDLTAKEEQVCWMSRQSMICRHTAFIDLKVFLSLRTVLIKY